MDIRKILSAQKNFDIQSNLPDGVLVTDEDGLVRWVNDVADTILKDKQIVSKSIDDILENGSNLIINSANTHKALIAKSTAGEEYFEITSRETEDGYVTALRDSTQNYKRISGILKEQESSQKINNDKNAFLVKLANEFNSPIQSIIGFAQGMIDGLGGDISEKQLKYINIIKKNSSELLYFFNKLVELSQSEGGLISKDKKYFDIVSVLDLIVKSNKHYYADKAVNINFEPDKDVKKTVYQYEIAFKLMMQDIIETFMREIELGKVLVTLNNAEEDFLASRNLPTESSLLITVSSNNFTVLETELPTLLNPYAVVETANKRTIARTLALGAASNIAKDLDGVMWAEILPMKGLVFNVVIPREKKSNE